MPDKFTILVHGTLEEGQHDLQRTEALEALPDVRVIRSATDRFPATRLQTLIYRVLWKVHLPPDFTGANRRLVERARRHRPDAILVESLTTLQPATLRRLRRETKAALAFLSPDDIVARHNITAWLRRSFPLWDAVFTTKDFNVAELREAGVRRPELISNIYTPSLHRPLAPEAVGPEFEAFDLVFVGQYEQDRARSLARLAEAGFSVVVYGPDAGRLAGQWASLRGTDVVLRPSAYGEAYVQAVHRGKIALCFLRKRNRDTITQRSIELPAMARPMLAEKTPQHDAHFEDGVEYVSFRDDDELIARARELLGDPERRRAVGEAGRRRCLSSGYDSVSVARKIAAVLREESERLRGALR